jgi:hypothetical protein
MGGRGYRDSARSAETAAALGNIDESTRFEGLVLVVESSSTHPFPCSRR